MLKKFFMNALSGFVGAWVALVLFGVVAVMVILGVIGSLGSGEMSTGVKSNSIFKIELSGEIEETETPQEMSAGKLLNGNIDRPATLNQLVATLAEAKVNKNIKMLYLDCQGLSASPATLNALREAVKDFKSGGKPVYAYGDYLTQGDLLVASVADSLFVNPAGGVSLNGVGGTSLYFKDLFDKLGVKFNVFKVGTYKSAVEPYILNQMSDPARAQLDTLYGNIWRYVKTEIADSRNIESSAIDSLMAKGATDFMPIEKIVEAKIVDRLLYRREMNVILGRATGQDPDKLSFVSPSDMISETDWGQSYASKRQIAVLYATGEIAEGSRTGINCEKLVPEIVKLADDENVKGLVMRVNSPGGSVFGSKQIAEALDYFKSKKKPFVVSMGDYAASGGYWISADADRIFADQLTITGSIGIFGLFPDISGLMAKVGVTPQTVYTNPRSAMPTILTSIPEEQKAELQAYINVGYDEFINRVANGRRLKPSYVRKIAEGRVWDGQSALKLKLVDELGSLEKAIGYCAKKAEMDDNYDVAVYPQYEPGFLDMLSLSAQYGFSDVFIKYIKGLEPNEEVLRQGLDILTRKPIQARCLEVKVRI